MRYLRHGLRPDEKAVRDIALPEGQRAMPELYAWSLNGLQPATNEQPCPTTLDEDGIAGDHETTSQATRHPIGIHNIGCHKSKSPCHGVTRALQLIA